MNYTGNGNGAVPAGGKTERIRAAVHISKGKYAVGMFTGNMLREHGEVQDLPTA